MGGIVMPDGQIIQPDEYVERLERRVEELEEALQTDRDKWSFNTLVFIAERLLTELYPEDIFPDNDVELQGDPGPQLVRAVRRNVATLRSTEEQGGRQ